MSAFSLSSAHPHTFLPWNMSDWTPPSALPDSSNPSATTTTADADADSVQLMLRVKEGDMRAFEQLVEMHQRAVIGTVTRMLNNVDDAHDVAQQVFVRVWRSAPRYEPAAKFTTWLFTITRNLVFNEMRRRGRKREMSLEEAKENFHHEPAAPTRNQPDTVAAQEELEKAIDHAIESLPDKQRLAVSLRRYEDMPYEEICDVLGMSLSAVKSLIFRARNVLKEKLASYLDNDA